MGTVRFDPPSKDAWGHLHLGREAICPFGQVTVKVRGAGRGNSDTFRVYGVNQYKCTQKHTLFIYTKRTQP